MEQTTMLKHTETVLEFDKIKSLWSELALMQATKEKIMETMPCINESELLLLQNQTTEARDMLEKCGMPPIPSFTDVAPILDTARKEFHLSAEQLETIGTAFTAVRRLREYLNRGKSYGFSLAYYEENLDPCEDVASFISQQIRNGRVDDHASNLLFSIRRELEVQDAKMREKVNQIIHSNKKYMADSFVAMRNGHMCVPVKAEYRSQIAGSVMDKSATGGTIFIEPAAISQHYNKIQMLKIEEENEELRICYELTAMLLEKEDSIVQNIKTVELLDFAFSKGKLSLNYGGIKPHINTLRNIHLSEARHPLLAKERCVPISFDVGGDVRGIVITGPNTGGKTVTIKTVSLCCLMAQCGLHVPCKEADISMNANILCDIGDGQNLADNLSTFSAHLKNILQILDYVSEESLVVLDELGSGTDPTEGMGIAIAVLKELKKSGSLFLVTTHYPEVKQYADSDAVIVNARMDFDKETLTPLYKLIIGESGESCAFSIAKRLGMPDAMIADAAAAAYGEDYQRHLPEQECYDSIQAPAKKQKLPHSKIIKKEEPKKKGSKRAKQFRLGDSVMIYPDKKIGIVCKTADDKGMLRVQLQGRKIWINHKRLKLHVAAAELYPEDYDFSILFDSVEHRKLRHQMERKYTEGTIAMTE